MYEGKCVPLRTHTQIINTVEFVRLALWNLDPFVSMNKVTFSADILFIKQYPYF